MIKIAQIFKNKQYYFSRILINNHDNKLFKITYFINKDHKDKGFLYYFNSEEKKNIVYFEYDSFYYKYLEEYDYIIISEKLNLDYYFVDFKLVNKSKIIFIDHGFKEIYMLNNIYERWKKYEDYKYIITCCNNLYSKIKKIKNVVKFNSLPQFNKLLTEKVKIKKNKNKEKNFILIVLGYSFLLKNDNYEEEISKFINYIIKKFPYKKIFIKEKSKSIIKNIFKNTKIIDNNNDLIYKYYDSYLTIILENGTGYFESLIVNNNTILIEIFNEVKIKEKYNYLLIAESYDDLNEIIKEKINNNFYFSSKEYKHEKIKYINNKIGQKSIKDFNDEFIYLLKNNNINNNMKILQIFTNNRYCFLRNILTNIKFNINYYIPIDLKDKNFLKFLTEEEKNKIIYYDKIDADFVDTYNFIILTETFKLNYYKLEKVNIDKIIFIDHGLKYVDDVSNVYLNIPTFYMCNNFNNLLRLKSDNQHNLFKTTSLPQLDNLLKIKKNIKIRNKHLLIVNGFKNVNFSISKDYLAYKNLFKYIDDIDIKKIFFKEKKNFNEKLRIKGLNLLKSYLNNNNIEIEFIDSENDFIYNYFNSEFVFVIEGGTTFLESLLVNNKTILVQYLNESNKFNLKNKYEKLLIASSENDLTNILKKLNDDKYFDNEYEYEKQKLLEESIGGDIINFSGYFNKFLKINLFYGICFCVPARLNSTRLNNKLLINFNNKSCISLTINKIKKSNYFNNNIFVFTDSELIKNELKNEDGVHVILNNSYYKNGTLRIADNLKNVSNYYKNIVNIQADEPFVSTENIDFCINKHLNSKETDFYYTTLHETNNSIEYLKSTGSLKCITNKNNEIIYYSRNIIPWNKNGEINDKITYKTFTGIYCWKRDKIYEYTNLINSNLQDEEDCEQLSIIENGGKILSFPTVEYNEISLNTEEDLNYLQKKYCGKYIEDKKIKLVVFDFDGVFTDGKTYIINENIIKSYNSKDTYSLSILKEKNIKIGIITRDTNDVIKNIEHIITRINFYEYGSFNKKETMEKWIKELNISFDECAYMGDDLPDIELLKKVNISGCPLDAIDDVKKVCKFISCKNGGEGAVRDFCDYLINKKYIN